MQLGRSERGLELHTNKRKVPEAQILKDTGLETILTVGGTWGFYRGKGGVG